VFLDGTLQIGARIDVAAKAAEQFDLMLHALDHADQARVFRGMNEHVVKIASEPPPLAGILLAQCRPSAVAAQLLLMVVEVAVGEMRTGEAGGQRLEPFAHLVNLDHVVDRVGRDEGALAFDYAHEAFALEPEYRFPDRRAADA
jgi:hypothetical protein